MKRKVLWLFLAKLIPLTLVLGYFWYFSLQLKYPDLIEPIAGPIFALFGVRTWWLSLLLEHYTSLVPYIALVFSVPDIIKRWRRAVGALLGGVAVIVLGHILMSIAVYYILELFPGTRTSFILIVPVYLINDALPLILWLLFFPGLFERLFRTTADQSQEPRQRP